MWYGARGDHSAAGGAGRLLPGHTLVYLANFSTLVYLVWQVGQDVFFPSAAEKQGVLLQLLTESEDVAEATDDDVATLLEAEVEADTPLHHSIECSIECSILAALPEAESIVIVTRRPAQGGKHSDSNSPPCPRRRA